MAHLEQEPFFSMAKAWDADDYMPAKQKFSKTTTAGRTVKGEVTPDDGEKTIEFTIDCTVAEFEEVRKDFQWVGPLRKIYPPPRDRPPGLTPEQIARMMDPDGEPNR